MKGVYGTDNVLTGNQKQDEKGLIVSCLKLPGLMMTSKVKMRSFALVPGPELDLI